MGKLRKYIWQRCSWESIWDEEEEEKFSSDIPGNLLFEGVVFPFSRCRFIRYFIRFGSEFAVVFSESGLGFVESLLFFKSGTGEGVSRGFFRIEIGLVSSFQNGFGFLLDALDAYVI